MDFDLGRYMWKSGEDLFDYSFALGHKLLRASKPKTNMVEKRWANFLPPSFKLRWMNTWHKQRSKKEVPFICAVWNEVVLVNAWRAKTYCTKSQGC
jgi:DNA polymerase III epsilon subunit-like protein